jgi:hypothetical protein
MRKFWPPNILIRKCSEEETFRQDNLSMAIIKIKIIVHLQAHFFGV